MLAALDIAVGVFCACSFQLSVGNRPLASGKVSMSQSDCHELQGHQLWMHSPCTEACRSHAGDYTSTCIGCMLWDGVHASKTIAFTQQQQAQETQAMTAPVFTWHCLPLRSKGVSGHMKLMNSTAVPNTGTCKCQGVRTHTYTCKGKYLQLLPEGDALQR